MIRFSEDYNAQAIFEQVWEAPYEWFALVNPKSWTLPTWVYEMDEDGTALDSKLITIEDIEKAVITNYMENVSKQVKPPLMTSYLEDLDANDVDCILQYAMFGEIRYS